MRTETSLSSYLSFLINFITELFNTSISFFCFLLFFLHKKKTVFIKFFEKLPVKKNMDEYRSKIDIINHFVIKNIF